MEQNFNKELSKIAKDIENDSEKMANEILDVVDELKDLDDKKAALINPGMKIVNVNPKQGLMKGRQYLCGDVVMPNYAVIKELDGTDIGVYRLDRFVVDNNEY